MEHPERASAAFTKDILERVAHTIADVEEMTHAEIRISIRDLREGAEVDMSLEELARKEFATLRMHETDGRVGILLLILYHEKKFYVFGDEGVHSRVNPETWTDVAEALRDHFAKADYEGGLNEALRKMEDHLRGKLPTRKEGERRLSDDVVVK
jgi:uncharacterized membrane protein